MSGAAQVVLLDNGSLNPAATLGLRKVAADLEELIGSPVEPVSTRYADRIDPELLGGRSARVWKSFLCESVEMGCRDFAVLPLFFGESDALARYVPQTIADAMQEFGPFRVRFAKPLVDRSDLADDGLARLLANELAAKMDSRGGADLPTVLLVDHGSPSSLVADCRNLVAAQMETLLEGRVSAVVPCSMERRVGAEYDFNEPMLEDVLSRFAGESSEGSLYLSYLFLFPGRHAGVGGDIDQIVAASSVKGLLRCPLVGESERLEYLLQARYEQLVNGPE